MKKFLLLITLLVGFVSMQAQVARVNVPLAADAWFIPTYTGVASDTLGTVTATTWSYEVPINKFDGVFFIMEIKLADKTTGANGVCTVQPQGRYFAGGTFANIGSAITWTGINSVDSTITIASVSSKSYYSYPRVLVTNTSGKSKVVSYKLIVKK
jgi:hypothetical protein